MAFPVYSTRFMAGIDSTTGFRDSFTVPGGKVAVIKCVTLVDGTGGGSGSLAALTIPGPIFVVIGEPTGPVPFLATDLSIVLQSGETMGLYVGSGQPYWSVNGFLLDA